MDVYIADLPHRYLALASSNAIWIDENAAGYGWSIGAAVESGRIDLLSAMAHELGHVLGLGHDAHDFGSLMAPRLHAGRRLLPTSSQVDSSARWDWSSPTLAATGWSPSPLIANREHFYESGCAYEMNVRLVSMRITDPAPSSESYWPASRRAVPLRLANAKAEGVEAERRGIIDNRLLIKTTEWARAIDQALEGLNALWF